MHRENKSVQHIRAQKIFFGSDASIQVIAKLFRKKNEALLTSLLLKASLCFNLPNAGLGGQNLTFSKHPSTLPPHLKRRTEGWRLKEVEQCVEVVGSQH